ncbi:MAG: hypothetical protein J0H74_22250 [Chitinophagaceae bacterium]|nr:hypothetical protein [Chitinophagaceae bacterium]
MKQIKWKLLIIALLGFGLAYANKPQQNYTYHRYMWLRSSIDGSKYWVGRDLTWYNWTKGIDYVCLGAGFICTFLGDPMKMHSDATGSWFYVSDVPQGGTDPGVFMLVDF